MEPSHITGANMKWFSHLEKQAVLQNVKYRITISPSHFTMQYMWKRTENICSYKNFVRVFIASLFIIPTKWKQYKCLLTAKWLKKNWYIHTIEYYSTIKSTELLRHSCKWTLKSIMLKERN